jgi:hypothetical protein
MSRGSDIAPDAAAREDRFLYLLRTYPDRPPSETFRQAAALIDEGPFPERDRAEYWIASARLAAGDRDGARTWFARLARDYPGSVWEERSWLGLGDAAARERDYGGALSWYEKAATAGDAAVRELSRINTGQARLLQKRQRIAWAAGLAGLAIAAFFAWSGRRSSLRPLPPETHILLPVLAVLAVLSVRVDPVPRLAILELCAGGAVLSLLSGMRLRALASRRTAATRAVHAALALAALGCLAYVAVYRGDLIGMVQETFRTGPE